ncbi:MAG TPA: hypothetical protein LFV66_05010 [Rickettsia endosymbiont of Bembidion lapponicum]|nr:hypothetical protein [Rickettsia endosymbiont of Bembidion lapponicum]
MNLIKKFLIISIILIPTLVLANTYRQINYKITPLNDRPVSAIKVETEIIGDIDGEVILDLPYAWASASYYQQLNHYRLRAGRLMVGTRSAVEFKLKLILI